MCVSVTELCRQQRTVWFRSIVCWRWTFSSAFLELEYGILHAFVCEAMGKQRYMEIHR